MKLSEAKIEVYIKLYHDVYRVKIDKKSAIRQATKLIHCLRAIAKKPV